MSRHRSSVICRSALAIGAQRGVAALADTLGARYGLRAALCAALRWLRAACDI
ncbi:hypothetical protein [Verminephrobacter eiseniae]|uniref:hypothetical protein n=1 Tax=Verminephrobacter eiseniae TaxID=364317 RepID=UPI0022389D21|nr:hypothetical protein [Verminephrobacter eiseniae]